MAIMKICFICNFKCDKLKDLNTHFKSDKHKANFKKEHGISQDEYQELNKKYIKK